MGYQGVYGAGEGDKVQEISRKEGRKEGMDA
jgi:hypothetical protein